MPEVFSYVAGGNFTLEWFPILNMLFSLKVHGNYFLLKVVLVLYKVLPNINTH